ncbi:DASH complex subunit ask1 [Aspergillus heteromorphus CBS 117.55]|uniref:DASH complex subunit ASK1 n=1 Tax=Aspergillus heteromorphus CBS 117.55 TaxID=1448321 RepID=A0A317VSY7_9EURO|nr:DASH complex subunit ask1 [Aspergillus heteromorphus CBS 117.55]PWY77446.1 DASH complex subunit ask1 [Aspergillus heteromorphus CBS 117.55]
MSRQPSQAQRPLTLTEELEKLEQSITLTLQEIDHNFSQAHRIVTTSILPVVEQYADSSRDVWQGAQFWKQFFEASANVSLSGYEEKPTEDTFQDQTASTAEEEDPSSTSLAETETQSPSHRATDMEMTSLSLSSHSTPRAPLHDQSYNDDDTETHFPHRPQTNNNLDDDFDIDLDIHDNYDDENDPYLPTTPAKYTSSSRHHSNHNEYATHDESHTPLSSSPFVPPPENPVLHQMHDKTYRVQATPLGKGYPSASARSKFAVTPKTNKNKYAYNDSPISSPEPEAPRLHAEIFSSPMKGVETPNTGRRRRPSSHRARLTPQPGLSVLTPARGVGGGGGRRGGWDSDDDMELDEDLGPSPPKTMQFHIPQSRLMKTPAKEASKRIVEDLLFTAGANDTTDDLPDEQSPSVIRRVERLEDETF